ncbi:hypothetical protein GE061_015274 [Apolygus lucorum]|uniref:Uncharacterized protein n=1 Tax=Apolygus lucorum TaxID=248454 RepID=A0A8S9XNA9_APOLU|nr:hypothetical protein GE061_015274 [Apolygus lucorum]
MRALGRETGPPCNCRRHRCFGIVGENYRSTIIKQFNLLANWNEQTAHLTGLISVVPVMNRTVRDPDAQMTACLRSDSCLYKGTPVAGESLQFPPEKQDSRLC